MPSGGAGDRLAAAKPAAVAELHRSAPSRVCPRGERSSASRRLASVDAIVSTLGAGGAGAAARGGGPTAAAAGVSCDASACAGCCDLAWLSW